MAPTKEEPALDGYFIHRYATIYNARLYKQDPINKRFAKHYARDSRDVGHRGNLALYKVKRDAVKKRSPIAGREVVVFTIGKDGESAMNTLVQVRSSAAVKKPKKVEKDVVPDRGENGEKTVVMEGGESGEKTVATGGGDNREK